MVKILLTDLSDTLYNEEAAIQKGLEAAFLVLNLVEPYEIFLKLYEKIDDTFKKSKGIQSNDPNRHRALRFLTLLLYQSQSQDLEQLVQQVRNYHVNPYKGQEEQLNVPQEYKNLYDLAERAAKAYENGKFAAIKLIPGAEDYLRQFKYIIVVTNSNEQNVKEIMKKLGYNEGSYGIIVPDRARIDKKGNPVNDKKGSQFCSMYERALQLAREQYPNEPLEIVYVDNKQENCEQALEQLKPLLVKGDSLVAYLINPTKPSPFKSLKEVE